MDFQVATLSGTGDDNLFVFSTSESIPSNWVAGDVLESGMTIDASGLTGVGYLAVRLGVDGEFQYDGAVTGANGNMPAEFNVDYKTKITVQSGASSVSLRIMAQTVNGESLAGTIKISSAFLEKII